jgi:hypothetical protein
MKKSDKEEYWDAIQRCINELFKMTMDVRTTESYAYSMKRGDDSLFFFHVEPLAVAEKLAGREATLEETKTYLNWYYEGNND